MFDKRGMQQGEPSSSILNHLARDFPATDFQKWRYSSNSGEPLPYRKSIAYFKSPTVKDLESQNLDDATKRTTISDHQRSLLGRGFALEVSQNYAPGEKTKKYLDYFENQNITIFSLIPNLHFLLPIRG